MNSHSELISLHSLNSNQKQTREKFSHILNVTKGKRTKTDSITKSTIGSSENLLENVNDMDVEMIETVNNAYCEDDDEMANKRFMLNKFLKDSESLINNGNDNKSSSNKKLPVPAPRTKLSSNENSAVGTSHSEGTFNVTSPKVLSINNNRKNSNSGSIRTFDVQSPKILAQVNKKTATASVEISSISSDEQEIYLEKADIELLNDNHNDDNDDCKEIIELSVLESEANYTVTEPVQTEKKKLMRSKNGKFVKENRRKVVVMLDEATTSLENPTQQGAIKRITRPKSTKKSLDKIDSYSSIDEENLNETKQKTEKKVSKNKKNEPNRLYNYKIITEIIIHKTEKLLLNSFVIHPVVKVHIVNAENGNYLKKSDRNRPVIFYYENEVNNFILPVMTNFYDLQQNRSLFPKWEETLLINEDFEYFINENLMIFFEIMDFSSSSNSSKTSAGHENGWYKIAFAFLNGKNNNKMNINKKLRLQLYYYDNSTTTTKSNKQTDHCPLWDLWSSKKKLKKYPSVLYVSIKPVASPKTIIETFRSKNALQKEDIKENNQQQVSGDEEEILKNMEQEKIKCKKELALKNNDFLPSSTAPHRFCCYENGCFVVKFSNDGKYLACAVGFDNNSEFRIVIYTVKNFMENSLLKLHKALIYSLAFSVDDKYLISASSDKTVAIWDFPGKLLLQLLPHPSFVYTSDINMENIIATGCYDTIIRIWAFSTRTSKKIKLHQDLKHHKGFVTSVCFTKKTSNFLYSADSIGKIIEWSKTDDGTYWEFNRILDTMELGDYSIINQIILFPSNEKRLLVHSRDSALRIISIKNACVIFWLRGALNLRYQTFCDISSNGNFVTAGSENGLAIIWNANTGEHVKTYEVFSMKHCKTVHCVQFHPFSNILIASHYGSMEPVVAYTTFISSKENQDTDNENVEQRPYNISKRQYHSVENNKKWDYNDVLKKLQELIDEFEHF